MKKAGVASRTMYSTRLGQRNEFVIMTPFSGYAEFDGPSPLTKALGETASAQLLDRIRKCLIDETDYISTRDTELSNIVERSTPAPIYVVTRYRVTRGKLAEWKAFMKSDILPVYKKANAPVNVIRRSLGTNNYDFSISTPVEKYADLDGGSLLTRTLGAEGVQKLWAKAAGLQTAFETVVRARMADYSF